MLDNRIYSLVCVPDLFLDGVYYVIGTSEREQVKFARLKQSSEGGWEVWYYTYKYRILRNKLGGAFTAIERRYRDYLDEILAGVSGKGG